MNRTRFAAVCLAGTLALLAGVAVHANTAEVTGEIKDTNGDPVQGALVRCWAASNPSLVYDGKTNKKGRFYIPGLVHPRQDDVFVFEIEYEGWVPVEVTIENRTVNRVLLGDPLTKKLAPGQEIPKVPIVPLGKARLDATLAPPDVAAELSAAGATETAEAAPVPDRRGARPSADPYQEALTLAGAGDAEGAVPLFDKAIEKEPEDAERRSAYARVLYKLERWDEARAQARRAIELAPADVSHRMVLYSVEMNAGDVEAAEAALAEAREVAPEDPRIWRQVAFVASRRGDVPAQIEAYEKVTALDPGDSEAWISLGGLYNETGDASRAETAYQRVVELEPENAHQVFFNLGALRINADPRTDSDVRQAVAAFRKAIEIKPDYANAHKQLGFALLSLGDQAGARQELQNYVRLAKDASDVAQMRKIIQTLPE